jgi:hypothetical protein
VAPVDEGSGPGDAVLGGNLGTIDTGIGHGRPPA